MEDQTELTANNYQLATLKRRGLSLSIDFIALSLLTMTLSMFLPSEQSTNWIKSLTLFSVASLYYVIMIGRFGQTLGKMITDIQVVNFDYSDIGYKQAFIRYLPYILFQIFSTIIHEMTIKNMDPIMYGQLMNISYTSLDPKMIEQVTSAQAAYTQAIPFGIFGQLSGMFSFFFIGLEFAFCLRSDKLMSIHDRLAKTIVIKISNNEPEAFSGDTPS